MIIRSSDILSFSFPTEAQAMAHQDTAKVGKRGTIVLPASLRRRFGLEEGSVLIAEEHEGGILLRPATVVPVEIYTDERRAEFLLSNSVDAEDYARAIEAVRKMGLDPAKIPHSRPPGV
jgi:AbrB family looped-hinge helix DNA binding protein